jgi:hypothetical protein
VYGIHTTKHGGTVDDDADSASDNYPADTIEKYIRKTKIDWSIASSTIGTLSIFY